MLAKGEIRRPKLASALYQFKPKEGLLLFQMICRKDNRQDSQTRLATNKMLQPVARPLPQQA